jgi:hypothetical protein
MRERRNILAAMKIPRTAPISPGSIRRIHVPGVTCRAKTVLADLKTFLSKK